MLKDILLTQRRELEGRLNEPYVERKRIFSWDLGDDLIKVITGPRRSGKSFFGLHLIQQTRSYGYVNFDDERLVGIGDYDEIITALNSVYGNPRYLLLDEIQNLPRWEMFANRLQRHGFRLLITGSNANLLSSELATHLTGRHTSLVMFPFSFGEYLSISADRRTDIEKRDALEAYAEQGGYPEPLLKKIDRHDYLRMLLQSTLYKDIIKRFKIRSVQGIDDLARYLMSNIAREYSLNSLSGVTRCRSVHTVDKYIHYLQEAYLVFSLKRFSFKLKNQTGQNKKIYCTDNGLAATTGFRFSGNRGALYENLVAIALKKEEITGRITAFFWKGSQGEEVDFIVKEGLKVSQLIQVCADISNPKTMKREMRALTRASLELNCADMLLLNDRIDGSETLNWQGNEHKIRLMPVWKWLENRM